MIAERPRPNPLVSEKRDKPRRWRFWHRRWPVLIVHPGETLILDAGARCTPAQVDEIARRAKTKNINVMVISGITVVGVQQGDRR